MSAASRAPAAGDVSVIIQGPVLAERNRLAPDGITNAVVRSVRRHLPGAQIVLSTWQGGPAFDEGSVDRVVRSADPGGYRFYVLSERPANPFNNGLRLLVSTQAGLAEATRPYVLKLRSDLALYGDAFLGFMHAFGAFDARWRAVQARILAYPLYSLCFEQMDARVGYRPFHVSDWCHFGLREDVNALYAAPPMPEPDTSGWRALADVDEPPLWPERLWRFSPEQYLTGDFARRTLGITFGHGEQADAAVVEASRRFVANNFAVLDQWTWKALSLKLLVMQESLPDLIDRGLYSHAAWHADYERYAVNGQEAPGGIAPWPRTGRGGGGGAAGGDEIRRALLTTLSEHDLSAVTDAEFRRMVALAPA